MQSVHANSLIIFAVLLMRGTSLTRKSSKKEAACLDRIEPDPARTRLHYREEHVDHKRKRQEKHGQDE